MKKKKWSNSKTVLTIATFLVVGCLMATSAWAARRVEFNSANASGVVKQLNESNSRESTEIGSALGLTPGEEFTLLQRRTDFNEVTHYRYQQSFKEFPVWGMHTIVSIDPSNQVVGLHGTMILDISGDIKHIPSVSSLDPLDALKRMKKKHRKKDKDAKWTFSNEKYGTYIYIKKNGKASLCYVVSFFADTETGNPSEYIHFINVKKNKVLHSFDMLNYADCKGPGGNKKTGLYYYGTDYPYLPCTSAGSTCTLETPDVKTCVWKGACPHSFPCDKNTCCEINGAYSPLNDAHFFGQSVFDMYKDWYGVPALPFQLTLMCHYGHNYENVFCVDKTIYIGDGYSTFFPMTALDVISHEVSHIFTGNNSGLIFSGESGGINDAFSDMAGEAAEYYVRGTNDFMVGYDIVKKHTDAVRYMYKPPLDGYSIDHVGDYHEGMNVHHSSGIFNKAFYLIATSPGWNTNKAFNIFVKANQDYWTPCTTFQQGAEGALLAALDYGYPCKDVVDAFKAVGILLTCHVSTDCTSSGDDQSYEYIAGVTVADLNNPSGASPYSDFTHLLANLARGETFNVELTPGFPDRPQAEYWKIWIDYNGDHDFEDKGEEVFSGYADSVNTVLTGVFTVPCDTVCCTRMRVSMRYGGWPPICGTFPYGEVEDYSVNIANDNPYPTADFTGTPIIGLAPLTVAFSDLSTNNPTAWDWDFGDSGTSTRQNPTHTYVSPGVYTVTLTVTNVCGSDEEIKIAYIIIPVPPVAQFEADSTYITEGDSVTFTDQSTGPPAEWDWVFPGGTPDRSDAQHPTVRYDTAGTYDVTLTVTNLAGYDDEPKTNYIHVSPYCTSWGNPTYMYIGGVKVADLENSPTGPTSYSDFTDQTAHLTQGETVNVELTHGNWFPGVWKIWIDYNGDNDFDDEGENVFTDDQGSETGSISVPCGTIIGETRMRVTFALYAPASCGDVGHGEVEDYTVEIAPNPVFGYDVGYTGVFPGISTSDIRRAQPFTMPEDGTIKSVSMYHAAGTGSDHMILAVYDGENSPQNRIAVTGATLVDTSEGWQTILLESPVFVQDDAKIWLAWVYEQTQETTTGIRRNQTGSPSAYVSDSTWPLGMPDPFDPQGNGVQENYVYSIYATYTRSECTVGFRDVFAGDSTTDNRRAQPFVMPEDGTIESISMYHEGGNGDMILAVYGGEGSPQERLAVTSVTAVDGIAGWQTIALESSVVVSGGTTIWLAWVYQYNPGIKYRSGSPGRYQSPYTWLGGMPVTFGDGTQGDSVYSIYANYITN